MTNLQNNENSENQHETRGSMKLIDTTNETLTDSQKDYLHNLRHWRQEAMLIEIVKKYIDEDVENRKNRPIQLVDVGGYGGELSYLFHVLIKSLG